MIYYESVKVTINVPGPAKVIINMVERYYNIFKPIGINQGLLFISKFQSSLCYFLDIKKKLFIAFYPQIDGQTERKNSTMVMYLRAFMN